MRYYFNPCWAVKASADNATATASKAAALGKRHFIVAVYGGYSATVGIKTLKIYDGTTVILEHYFNDFVEITFSQPLACSDNAAAKAEIPASGTAGTVGKINLIGFTTD